MFLIAPCPHIVRARLCGLFSPLCSSLKHGEVQKSEICAADWVRGFSGKSGGRVDGTREDDFPREVRLHWFGASTHRRAPKVTKSKSAKNSSRGSRSSRHVSEKKNDKKQSRSAKRARMESEIEPSDSPPKKLKMADSGPSSPSSVSTEDDEVSEICESLFEVGSSWNPFVDLDLMILASYQSWRGLCFLW